MSIRKIYLYVLAMKYFVLIVFALCPCLLIFGTFWALCGVLLFAVVLLYLCRTKSGKIVKIGLARTLIKLEKLLNE